MPDVTRAHALMLEYFEIECKDGMLEVMYKTFEKARIAGFTKVLATGKIACHPSLQPLIHPYVHYT